MRIGRAHLRRLDASEPRILLGELLGAHTLEAKRRQRGDGPVPGTLHRWTANGRAPISVASDSTTFHAVESTKAWSRNCSAVARLTLSA